MKYSLLVNSTDSFEDCWIPFFKLFKTFWPNFNGTLYLNTELKQFSYPGLTIHSVQNNKVNKIDNITWSECLIRALNGIEDDIVLYMQDDYFIKSPVKNDVVEKYVDLMHANPDIDCIHLTDQGVDEEKKSEKYQGLYEVKLKQRYRISCQAALWKKSVLLEYLRTYENAWQFEEFGSKRAAILKHNFYVVDKSEVVLNKSEIIPYIFTGIIKGRWYEEVIDVFSKNNICIDYSIRGMVKDSPKKPLLKKVEYHLKKIPFTIKHLLDAIKLRKAKAI